MMNLYPWDSYPSRSPYTWWLFWLSIMWEPDTFLSRAIKHQTKHKIMFCVVSHLKYISVYKQQSCRYFLKYKQQNNLINNTFTGFKKHFFCELVIKSINCKYNQSASQVILEVCVNCLSRAVLHCRQWLPVPTRWQCLDKPALIMTLFALIKRHPSVKHDCKLCGHNKIWFKCFQLWKIIQSFRQLTAILVQIKNIVCTFVWWQQLIFFSSALYKRHFGELGVSVFKLILKSLFQTSIVCDLQSLLFVGSSATIRESAKQELLEHVANFK